MKRKYNLDGARRPTLRHCKECDSKYFGSGNSKYCSRKCLSQNEYAAKMFKYEWRLNKLYSAAKFRAIDKNVNIDITTEYLIDLWNKSGGTCSITKRPFDLSPWGKKGQVNPNAPSIDRIIPELGYIKGNVRLVIYHINVALSEFGLDALKKLAKDINVKESS